MMGPIARAIHIGVVVDNRDPERRGRVLAEIPTLLGPNRTWPEWIEATFPYLGSTPAAIANKTGADAGWFFPPDVGTTVMIEIVAASSPARIYDGPNVVNPSTVRYFGQILTRGEKITTFDTDEYPNRKGIRTSGGHNLVFDDGETPAIEISSGQGNLIGLYDDGPNQSAKFKFETVGSEEHTTAAGFGTSFSTDKVSVARGVTASAAIKQGVGTSFTSALAAALTELSAVAALLGVPTPNATALNVALLAGNHTAQRLDTE